jgi:hypothetical protein
MTAFAKLVDGMQSGTDWQLFGQTESVRDLLNEVFDERIHRNDRGRYQLRVNLQKKPDNASYAGFIVEEGNPRSGPYQGTSFVFFPGEGGSVVALGIGTDGFGTDTAILGRPGHGRRLRALARLHAGRLWVKPDLLDIATEVRTRLPRLGPPLTPHSTHTPAFCMQQRRSVRAILMPHMWSPTYWIFSSMNTEVAIRGQRNWHG